MFYYHKLLRRSNIRKFERKLLKFKELFDKNKITYDEIYSSFEGWLSYIKHGNTYCLRKKIINDFQQMFKNEISSTEVNRIIKSSKLPNRNEHLLN